MQLIYHLLTILLLWLHLAALAALAGPRLGSWAIGRAGGLLALVLTLFCLEHFVGLGALTGLWPVSTLAAAGWLWHRRAQLAEGGFWRAELVFGLAFAYGLAWKFGFPSIYPTSERVTDLYFIDNYLSGSRLPPPDLWYPPYRFDFYYALQHYGAALAGRWLQLSPGLTYNLSFAMLMALPIALAWDLASRFTASRGARLLLVAALAVGGTGAGLVNRYLIEPSPQAGEGELNQIVEDRMWGNARLIGLYDQRGNTVFAHDWFPRPADGKIARELPLENFGYQYYVGDYHPPIGGYALLLLALALICAFEMAPAGAAVRNAQLALLAATVPATIAVNTWVFPLQALLIGGWAGWRHWQARRDPERAVGWPALLAGGGAALLLLYPFLAGFTARSLNTPIRLVQSGDHTPLISFLALTWPLLILLVLGLFRRGTRGLALYFALSFGLLLLMSEVVFVDDPSGDQYQRTNTVMKWWGWIWTGGLTVLGALLLSAPARWQRWVAGLALVGTLSYALDVANYWRKQGFHDFGRLSADAIYTGDPIVRAMFRHLRAAPDGIVLENSYGDAYHDGGIYSAFAAKQTLLGWPSHLSTWHGYVEEVWTRREQIQRFYAGQLPDARRWLAAHKVRYIVWNPRDSAAGPAWAIIDGAIRDDYQWIGFGRAGNMPVGLWVRL
ncbi:DUF2298 domain-containing protein [Chitinimonas koreensis]|uniref:DUF2298 domain-containing protein n=1 Tax=Chitinimonas koreensis TaxID=356302 RepID=UPI000411C13D|nr:DUF2298 domain-containing protein [Chitinimonas koreensis]QNM98384.1 hypothetical protein H9L41_09190 [Chitinimonas koreensis]